MKRFSFRQTLLFLLAFSFAVSHCDAQPSGTGPVGRTKTGFFARVFDRKQKSGVKKPRSAQQVKKEQDRKKKQQQEAYVKNVKENKNRSFQIQSPEVKAKMKQDQKDIEEREKARKKKVSEASKKARKKYK